MYFLVLPLASFEGYFQYKRGKITLSWCQEGQGDNSAEVRWSVRKLCEVLEHGAQVMENIVYRKCVSC